MGPGASDAVPELIKIYGQNISEESRGAIVLSLGSIGPAASNSVPLLLMQSSRTNDVYAVWAIWALGQIHAQPEIVVPTLTKLLGNADPGVKGESARALGRFGAAASAAVPALLEYLNEKKPGQLNSFREALVKIDPEVASKAGFK